MFGAARIRLGLERELRLGNWRRDATGDLPVILSEQCGSCFNKMNQMIT